MSIMPIPYSSISQATTSSKFINALCMLLLSGLSACGGNAEEGVACTTEARTSVLLTVVDQLNVALPGVNVNYQVNGGVAQSQLCEPTGKCAIAFETTGIFLIMASKAGYTSASGMVTVTRDVCHVITESLTLTLSAPP